MKLREPPTLSMKDLASRWRVSVRSVRRILQRHPLAPVQFSGKTRLYFANEVEKYERRLRRPRT